MTAFKVQKVGTKDIHQVVELAVESLGANEVKAFKQLESHLDTESWLYLLAKQGTEPVGIMECTWSDEAGLAGTRRLGCIRTLFVKPGFRRQGAARQLLQIASYWFQAAEVAEVRAVTTEDAAAFLTALGFASTRRVWSRAGTSA